MAYISKNFPALNRKLTNTPNLVMQPICLKIQEEYGNYHSFKIMVIRESIAQFRLKQTIFLE